MAARSAHTCAITAAGGVTCWGSNTDGQLGDGTSLDRIFPVSVTGLTSSMTTLTAGSSHTCGLTEAGAVKCWGKN
ncbi:MAG: chromosome condensation regulator RCC1, partial [Chloroflexi bacterium]|nr:chromosome condensation regulator RCC1 [Chloroflexota bacterium]